MARNFFRIFIENKPVRGLQKKYNIPGVNWLNGQYRHNHQPMESKCWLKNVTL